MGGFHGPEGRSRLCRVHLSYCRISGGCNCAELDIAADFLSTGGRTDAAWPCRGERLLRTGPETGAWNGCQLAPRSEEHTSELQSLMRISYAVFCLQKTKIH